MKKKFCFIALLSSLALTSCGNVGEEISEGISSKLVPNLGSFLTQLAALIIMIVLIIMFGYKPIKKMITKRQDFIENNIEEAKNKNKEAELALIQSKESVLASKHEAELIIQEAKDKANKERESIILDTQKEVKEMKEMAQREIKESELEAKESIRKEMISVALDASKELLKRNINDKDNEKLVEDFINEIDS